MSQDEETSCALTDIKLLFQGQTGLARSELEAWFSSLWWWVPLQKFKLPIKKKRRKKQAGNSIPKVERFLRSCAVGCQNLEGQAGVPVQSRLLAAARSDVSPLRAPSVFHRGQDRDRARVRRGKCCRLLWCQCGLRV